MFAKKPKLEQHLMMRGTIIAKALPVFGSLMYFTAYIDNASHICRNNNELATLPSTKFKLYIEEYTKSHNYNMIKILTAKYKIYYKFILIKCYFLKIKKKILRKYYMITNS